MITNPNRPRQLSVEQELEVIRLFKDGKTGGTIARMMTAATQKNISRSTIAGILYRANVRREGAPRKDRRDSRDRIVSVAKANPKKIRDQRRAITLKEKAGSFGGKRSQPFTQYLPDKDEPEVIGPLNDFPPRGHCQYTKDHPNEGKPWRMCGQKGQEVGPPYCEWHLVNRINKSAA